MSVPSVTLKNYASKTVAQLRDILGLSQSDRKYTKRQLIKMAYDLAESVVVVSSSDESETDADSESELESEF